MFDFDVRDVHGTDEMRMGRSPFASAGDLADPIAEVCRRPPLILLPTCSVEEAVCMFAEHDHTIAMIASHGVLLGTLSEKQLLRRLRAEPEGASHLRVWRLMRIEPETLQESDSVGYALQRMRVLELSAMPVLHASGTLVGLLESRDLVTWIGSRTTTSSHTYIGHG